MSKAMMKFRGDSSIHETEVSTQNSTVELRGKHYKVDSRAWDTPVTGTIYGTLLNYKGSLQALGNVNDGPYYGAPKAPVLYIKPANTITGYGAAIPLPKGVTELEMGATLGVVIGRTATRLSADEALDFVMGYTVVNDVCIPHSSVYRPAISQRARDGFCPVGPWVIERDAVENPDQISIRVFINGQLCQEINTINLLRCIPRLLADISDFMTLDVGDMVLVGVPERAPLAKAGDHVQIEIDGVGTLANYIVHENEMPTGGSGLL